MVCGYGDLSCQRQAGKLASPQLALNVVAASGWQRQAADPRAASRPQEIPFKTMAQDITHWISEAQKADSQAAQVIWETYFQKLISYARKKMQGMPRRATDEEDVALSAMNSFFDGMHQGRFMPQDRDELWKLLATITVRKATRELRRHHAQKRGGGAVRGESVFIGGANESASWGINEVMDAGNLPAMSMQLTATCADMLAQLEDDSLRAIARSRLEGFSNEEIAQRMQISLATVKRRLARIRETWS